MPNSRGTRALRGIGLALLALLLTLFFLVLRFPTDVLGRSMVGQLEDRTGVRIDFGELERRPLGIKGQNVRVQLPNGERVVLDTLRIYPACSSSWLTLSPSFWIDIDADEDRGDIEGVLRLGNTRGFKGELRNVDLLALPTDEIVRGFAMTGRIDGNIELAFEPGQATAGEVSFQARDGMLRAPNLPLPLPFERLNGELTLGGDQYAQVHGLQLRGLELDGDVKGSVGYAERPGQQPLTLELSLKAKGPHMRPFLQQLGVRLDRDGSANLDLTGTLSNPTFR